MRVSSKKADDACSMTHTYQTGRSSASPQTRAISAGSVRRGDRPALLKTELGPLRQQHLHEVKA